MKSGRSAIHGCVSWRAPSQDILSINVDPGLASKGHISTHRAEFCWATVFGSIANHAEIAVRQKDAGLPAGSDAELVCRRYLADRQTFLEGLAGDFAFVLWNERERELLLIRNHAGTRPLFYVQQGDCVWFASDIASIVERSGMSAIADEEALACYLVGEPAPAGMTLMKGVRTVPPAHVARFRSDGVTVSPYWCPEQCQALGIQSLNEAREHLVPLLRTVVGQSIASFDQIAAHVTGGLDSSTVAAFASKIIGTDKTRSLCGYAWQPPHDSSKGKVLDQTLIDLVGSALALQVVYVPVNLEGFFSYLALDPLAQPITSTLLHELGVMEAAGRAGVDVIVSGWGGDELISYNGRHQRSMRARFREKVESMLQRSQSSTSLPRSRGYLADNLQAKMPSKIGRLPYTGRATKILLLRHGHLAERTDSWSVFGARHGFQYAYPLLDRRIIEFSLGLPETLQKRGRPLLRMVLDGMVPDEVRMNQDKGDAARVHIMKEVIVAALCASDSSSPVASDRARYVDLERFAGSLAGCELPPQPGKFVAAWSFLHDPAGMPIGTLVRRSSK